MPLYDYDCDILLNKGQTSSLQALIDKVPLNVMIYIESLTTKPVHSVS